MTLDWQDFFKKLLNRISPYLGVLLIVLTGVHSFCEAKNMKVTVQIEDPFSPFKTKEEERRYSLKNDHVEGQLNPLPSVLVEVNGQTVFNEKLKIHGNPMTHVYYGAGSYKLPSQEKNYSVRVFIDSQKIDESRKFETSKGLYIFIYKDEKTNKPVFKQLKSKPLYR